jgi:hypothetical protein
MALAERPYIMPPAERLADLNAIAKLAQIGPRRVDLSHLGKPRLRTAKTAAAVSQKLRFAVLARDRYRCQACGASPALDPACTLEIDHVQPVSKGGRRRRRTCACCAGHAIAAKATERTGIARRDGREHGQGAGALARMRAALFQGARSRR